ncbi:hypothetical protein BJY21_003372 [Kineosphaera limosa]|nr:hypothetical protein [Kineosphaera limosa]NYE02188.1 hypothetical protein [Kineosphaera limosa]
MSKASAGMTPVHAATPNAPAGRPRAARLRRTLTAPGAVALLAQVWQAAGSFAIQVLAAHLLGASGLAIVSLCFGIVILATAVSSGIVGDSLTVLDRRDPVIRGGLVAWLLLVAATGAVVGALGMILSGTLAPLGALAFAAALVAFMVEDIVRRTHMALLRFANLLLIDAVALIGALIIVGIAATTGDTSVTTFLLAIAGGQVAGALVGWVLLPREERRLGAPRSAGVRAVGAFGLWRGAQVALTPLIQTAARIVVVAAVGASVLGHIEAGRIYMAPAMLAVQGFGSYLFATYARRADAPLGELTRLAGRSAAALSAGALALGAVAVLLVPVLGPLVSGSSFMIDPVVVLGWASVAAAAAWLQPFASLAATRGAQRRVFAVRLIDAIAAPSALWVGLAWLGLPAEATPFVLAAGLVLAGGLVRLLVLRPLASAHEAMPRGAAAPTP